MMDHRQERIRRNFARKLAFSKLVESKQISGKQDDSANQWSCCRAMFTDGTSIHKHIAMEHKDDVKATTESFLINGCDDSKLKTLRKLHTIDTIEETHSVLPEKVTSTSVFPWLPDVSSSEESSKEKSDDAKGTILLFYKYRDVPSPEHMKSWQLELCRRLHLMGKVRVGKEGINATVGGTTANTGIYTSAVLSHPWFNDMLHTDFKTSPGCAGDFPDGLKVGIYEEIVPMGINPAVVSHKDTGVHLDPAEFHKAIEEHLTHQTAERDSVLVDCRNFYESKIGQFKDALAPDIRKFSYFPEYVDKNLDTFRDKNVYMYCTGGIRCERGSAYLKAKGVCKEVYQLNGGIHKYLESYPDGLYRGKLFVFDNRYTISSNDDILSNCFYCAKLYDSYKPCSSAHCHILVLICEECTAKGFTTCCPRCQLNTDNNLTKEECDCTHNRPRIPKEDIS
ncbi:unnamed protein product [Owenia fusiformis]|uniref:Thiosulfate sulfurtransferase/rhodanese-like domain-containing protein 2 n=1 Tax=Owenia fusiformis TaxID=6347 RepID=A0A8J1XRY7_OWEFU|nr:unnamed protein product [Owenia fusiformis]